MCVPYSQTSCHSPLLQDDFGNVWGAPEQCAPVHPSTSWGGWWGKGMGTGLFLARRDWSQYSLGSEETPRCWLALGTPAPGDSSGRWPTDR